MADGSMGTRNVGIVELKALEADGTHGEGIKIGWRRQAEISWWPRFNGWLALHVLGKPKNNSYMEKIPQNTPKEGFL